MKIFITFFILATSLSSFSAESGKCILGRSTNELLEKVVNNLRAKIHQSDLQNDNVNITPQVKNIIHQSMILLYGESMEWEQALQYYTINDIHKYHGGVISFFEIPSDTEHKYILVSYHVGVGGDISATAGVVYRTRDEVEIDQQGKPVFKDSSPRFVARVFGDRIDSCTSMN